MVGAAGPGARVRGVVVLQRSAQAGTVLSGRAPVVKAFRANCSCHDRNGPGLPAAFQQRFKRPTSPNAGSTHPFQQHIGRTLDLCEARGRLRAGVHIGVHLQWGRAREQAAM